MVFPLNNAEVALRDRRGPGAGRQAARDAASPVPAAPPHLLRRPARPAPLRPARPARLRRSCCERGRAWDAAHPGFFDARAWPAARPTTSPSCSSPPAPPAAPKGVVPHAPQLHRGRRAAACEFDRLGPGEDVLAYLPMAWIGRTSSRYAQWLVGGFTLNCPESAETVMIDMREIGPTYYFAPPRIFEGLLTSVIDPHGRRRRAQALAVPRFMELARRVGAGILDGAAGRRRRPPAVRARRPAGLRAAAQRAGHDARARGLHRGRGDRAGPVRLLPLDRHQPEAALRLDRDLRLSSACSPTARSSRRPWAAPRRGVETQGRRRRRDPGARRAAAQGLLQETRRPPPR